MRVAERVLNLLRPAVYHTLQNIMLYPAPMGALTQLYAGTTIEGANLGGQVGPYASTNQRAECLTAHGLHVHARAVSHTVGPSWEG